MAYDNPELVLSIMLNQLKTLDGAFLARLALVSKHMNSCVKEALPRFDYKGYLHGLPNGCILQFHRPPKRIPCSKCQRLKLTHMVAFKSIKGANVCNECLKVYTVSSSEARTTYALHKNDLAKLDYIYLDCAHYDSLDIKRLTYLKHKGQKKSNTTDGQINRTEQLNELLGRLIPEEARKIIKDTSYCKEFITSGGEGVHKLQHYLSGYANLAQLVKNPEDYMREYLENAVHTVYRIANEIMSL